MSRTLRTLAVIAVLSGASLLGFYVLSIPVDTSPILPASAGNTSAPAGTQDQPARFRLDGLSPASFPETVERPLFWSTRRAKPPAPAHTPVADPRPAERSTSGLRLAGVMRGDDGKPRALIVSPDEPGGRWLEVGGEVDGWKLTRIGTNGVNVEAAGRRHELKLQ